jgi:uncharacterized membrane protein
VNTDGTIVTGTSYTPADDPVSFIWTRTTGDQTLLAADSARALAIRASGISGNGAVIVGTLDPGGPINAFRWTAAGKAVSLGTFPGGTFSTGESTNSDGTVVVGRSSKASNGPDYPFRWVNNVMSDIPGFSAPTAVGHAWDVSDNGTVVVGESDLAGHRVPFRWTVGQANATNLGVADGTAYAVSGNGLVVVGWLGTNSTLTPFRWTSGTSVQTISGSAVGSSGQASDTSLDGSVVVGTSVVGPWIWDATNGARPVTTVLNAAGIIYTGWSLTTVDGVSRDGKVLIGAGVPPSGPTRGWIARLP